MRKFHFKKKPFAHIRPAEMDELYEEQNHMGGQIKGIAVKLEAMRLKDVFIHEFGKVRAHEINLN